MTDTFFYFDKQFQSCVQKDGLCLAESFAVTSANPPPPPVDEKKVTQRSINDLSSYTGHEYFKLLSGSGTCNASAPRPPIKK